MKKVINLSAYEIVYEMDADINDGIRRYVYDDRM